jgi:hypothetical protein
MAILFGTTAEGETLPVEVNEFGQLVAEGLPGPPGADGAPGIGELPPDPVEGDTLIWQDGQLVWKTPEGGGMQIKQIQRGIALIESTKLELTVNINVVDPAKTLLNLLGIKAVLYGETQKYRAYSLSLNSGSRLLIQTNYIYQPIAPPPDEISWELVEYM